MTDKKHMPVTAAGETTIVVACEYFDGEAGGRLRQLVTDLFRQGCRQFVVDFAECKIATSLGISAVMDLALIVLDDLHARMVLCNLDPVKVSVFQMVGVIPLLQYTTSRDEALAAVKTDG